VHHQRVARVGHQERGFLMPGSHRPDHFTKDPFIAETMPTKSIDFKETMTRELSDFVQSQARALSLTELHQLVADLPALRERFRKIPARPYPDLAAQLQFLSLVVEDQIVRDPAGKMVGEAGFALLYFQRATDLIPDGIPGLGLLDDAMVVRIVLRSHEQVFKFSPHGYHLSWPAPRFDIDQLLSVVSPLRLTWFYLSMATEPR
jgi:uncharacterized membrane protein YkvA (DUF1232 family)